MERIVFLTKKFLNDPKIMFVYFMYSIKNYVVYKGTAINY